MKKLIPVLFAVLLLVTMAVTVHAEENANVVKGNQVAVDAAKMTFPADATEHTAVCPVCGVSATWLPLTPEVLGAGFTAAEANTHYYLTDSVEAAGAKFTMANSSSYTSCLHLNGKNITNTDGVAVEGAAGGLNIMGTGIVKGNGAADDYSSPATLLMGNKGSVNLYGGTYEKYDAATATNTVGIGWGGGTIAIYGATVNAGTSGSAVFIDSTMGSANATLNIYGGTIDGSASTDAPAVNTEAAADDATNKVTIHMYSGTIKGGTRSYGGSVPLQKYVTMNMYGGTVQDGEATTSGGNIYVATGAVFNMHGGIIQSGEAATHGGNIYVATSAQFNMFDGTIQDGKAGTSGGNVMVYTSAAFNMYDGTITRGTANLSSTNYLTGGGNVFAYTSAEFNMYDGTISSGTANKGGNVGATKKAALNITGGIIELGTAKAEGGNLFTSADSDTEANRVIVNLSNVIIRNGSTTAGPGGNVGVNRVSLTIGEGTQILDGTAQGSTGRAGNVRVYIGTIVMTGGTISGGTSSHADGTDEIWVQGTSSYPSVMYMLGGVIESTEADSYSLRVDANGRLYLGGNATVVDNNAANAEIYGNGPVYICDGWTGSATIQFKTAGTTGSQMSTSSLQVVTLDADRNATAGGSFTGKLKDFTNGAQLACTGDANGALTIGGLAVVDAAGNVTMTTDPLGLWATGDYAYIRLYNAYEITDPADGLWIDVNGCALTLSGSGTVNAFDTANDTYRAAACGKVINNGTVTVNQDVTAPNGNRYLAVADGNTTTMHRIGLKLTAVTLRTTEAGVYYKAKYECDETLASKVKRYGVVVSLADMPGEDFLTEWDENQYTTAKNVFESGVIATSGSVFNIMKASITDPAENAARGEMDIYANPYICFNFGKDKIVVADNENPGKTVDSEGFDGAGYSLHDVMDMLDNAYMDYTAATRKAIDSFYQKWQQKGMADWEFVNIGSQASRIDNSPLEFAAGSTEAQCPVCKANVTWIPFSQSADTTTNIGTPANGAHYYLTEDITYTGSSAGFITAGAKNETACLHLNGHNLTATAHAAVYSPYATAGVINIMGEGTVSGNRSGAGTTIYLSSKDAAGTINLYGGTYVQPASNTSSMTALVNGGSIHVYDDAWLKGNGSNNAAYVDKAGNAATTFAVHGGKITDGELATADGAATKARTVIVEGHSYVEQITIRNKDTAVQIAGAPVIDYICMDTGVKLTVGNLVKGAKITVSAVNGAFTHAFEKAEEYKDYFYAWNEPDSIGVTEAGELSYDVNYEHYMTPYTGDVTNGGQGDGEIHYYFMAAAGMIIDPDNGGDKDKWGDSCLVVFPNGETMLIDSGYEVQAPVITGNMKRMGVTTLDYLVITHPHGDHAGGVFGDTSTFLDEITVNQVYYQGQSSLTWDSCLETKCTDRNIPYEVIDMGDVLTFGEGEKQVTLTMLWPGTEIDTTIDVWQNKHSMVFRFDYGEHSSLFTADIYDYTDKKLIALYTNGELDVDMMKVPHHGLGTNTSSVALLAAVTPEIAVATGSFDIPSTITTRYADVGATLLEDRFHGYIHISSGADGVMTAETE